MHAFNVIKLKPKLAVTILPAYQPTRDFKMSTNGPEIFQFTANACQGRA